MNYESVTIIVGATDECESLLKTVRYVMSDCDERDIAEILIVCSKNASADCLDAIDTLSCEYTGKVRGLMQTRPFIGGAIRDGFECASSSHIMLLPGDMGIDLSAVSRMISNEKEAPDGIVKTSRWLKKDSFHGYNGTRRYINRAAQTFLRLLYGVKLTDFTNPVQIMPTCVYKTVDWQELNFPFLIELVLVFLRLGVKVTEIPAECYGRKEGKSKNSAVQTALYLKTALRVRFTPVKKLLKRG